MAGWFLQFHDGTPRNTMIRLLQPALGGVLLCGPNRKHVSMKHSLLLSTALLSAVAATAQTTVTVSVAAQYADQVFYSLENDEQATNPLADWDLGFEINGFNSSILVNTAKGLTVYETPVAVDAWETLTTPDVENWTLISNSDQDWSAGALTHGNNLSEPMGFHLGWGEYSMDTHFVVGDKVYVIEVAPDVYIKLRIDALISGVYTFTYADLDGGNEQAKELVKSEFAGKNFGYFNLTSGSTVDLEPAAASWDLLFTKYTAMVENEGEIIPYNATGVLQNKEVGAIEVDGVDPALATWAGAEFDPAINIVGYDWKSINMSTFLWDIDADRTYFVNDRAGNIWKIVFSAFGGSSTGDFTFSKELVSSVGFSETTIQELVVYPNPSRGGVLNMVLGSEVRNGQLSIVDLAGKLVKQQNVNGSGALSAVPVDLSGVQPGLYVVRLDAEGRTFSTRVVVE